MLLYGYGIVISDIASICVPECLDKYIRVWTLRILPVLCLAWHRKNEIWIFQRALCQGKIELTPIILHLKRLVLAHLHMTNRRINPITEKLLVVILSKWYLCRLYVRCMLEGIQKLVNIFFTINAFANIGRRKIIKLFLGKPIIRITDCF